MINREKKGTVERFHRSWDPLLSFLMFGSPLKPSLGLASFLGHPLPFCITPQGLHRPSRPCLAHQALEYLGSSLKAHASPIKLLRALPLPLTSLDRPSSFLKDLHRLSRVLDFPSRLCFGSPLKPQ
ncbi:hypothetical protein F2Q70_00011641 [Brassica cretica]|uniref:Uncharacterized protein n=2 Tax=Brassica cretica TaxID=69181 RepID=A0A3N6SWU3_BRACR|nr:hypothetical protein F2Q68_00046767 [Brassica cretica]KAF2610046.1 hypothetical protein F2Q70_00011641 [Brassica cretica]KAF3551625.1 hypothetical protein DY000_02007036 [Brassica cretica]